MKLSKFLLCENPLINSERVLILHTREPMLLAQVIHYEDITDEQRMDIERKITTTAFSRLDYAPETIYLLMIRLMPDESFVKLSAQDQANKLAGIMRRMADWYESYLIFEDKNL